MARPLPLTNQTFKYPLQPAKLDLASEVGRMMVTAGPDRMALLSRIYSNMTPAAKARCDFTRSWLVVQA